MDNIEIVKAYYAALDSADMEQAGQYLSENYRLVDFTPKPMDKDEVFVMVKLFKNALPNLNHSLSNMRTQANVVKVSIQLAGTNSGQLDLRKMGIGVIPSTQRFIIFPSGDYEITLSNGKINMARDVSPISPNRRMSGMLKALGINMATL